MSSDKKGGGKMGVVEKVTGDEERRHGNTIEVAETDPAELVSRANKELQAKLDALDKAKDSDFEHETADYWKPDSDPNAPKVLKGVYMGSVKEGRYVRHIIAVKDSKTGQPIAMRVNGTHAITKSVKRNGAVGKGVRIEYLGTKQTEAGNRFFEMDISWSK